MGLLVKGKWQDEWYDTESTGGAFLRQQSVFRNTEIKAEKDRYHLYFSYACPWAHRALIFRKLKGLEEIISASSVGPLMLENGWEFSTDSPDPLYQKRYLYQVYLLADPNYTGRVTVPVLWDKKDRTIVNNESSDIIRIFNSQFDALADKAMPLSAVDFYPAPLREKIDQTNAWVYDAINDGVYKAGFATRQSAYEEAFDNLFAGLDKIEGLLSTQKYLVGNEITESDWRLFTTLIRFDAVYYSHFKCNWQRIKDYPNLVAYLRSLFNVPGVAETVKFDDIKLHYYGSHKHLNPSGIVPKGPRLDYLKVST